MNQGGGLESVAGPLAGHARGGELAQLVVDERKQVGRRLAIAGRGGVKKMRHIGHGAEYIRSRRRERGNPPRNVGAGCRQNCPPLSFQTSDRGSMRGAESRFAANLRHMGSFVPVY